MASLPGEEWQEASDDVQGHDGQGEQRGKPQTKAAGWVAAEHRRSPQQARGHRLTAGPLHR